MGKYTFAPQRNWLGGWDPPVTIEVDDEPEKTAKPAVEDNTPFVFAPARKAESRDYFDSEPAEPTADEPFRFAPVRKKAGTDYFDIFGADAPEPAMRTEYHLYKNLQLDNEDDLPEPGAFRKRRTDFSVGSTVRWLQMKKSFVITKLLYSANGLYLVHGDKLDGAGEIRGFFHPSELATLPG
jgi:hypothetical protein